VGRKDGSLDLWNERDFRPSTSLWKEPAPGGSASVSPDGKWLCVPTPKGGVTVMSIAGKDEKKVLRPEGANVAFARFTPDSRHLCTVGQDGRSTVWDWPGGRIVRSWENKQASIWDAAISPDGKYLATAGGVRDQFGEVKLWDLTEGQEFKSVRYSSAVNVLAFSENGKYLATGHYDGSWSVWADWIRPLFARNPYQPVRVTVQTFRAGQEEGDYQVRYVSKGHLHDKDMHRILGRSSPAEGEMPAGSYYFWAEKGRRSSKQEIFTISARRSNPIPLDIPE
jgi:hypothetical protein